MSRYRKGTIVAAVRPLHTLTHLWIVIGVSVYVFKEASWPFAPWEEYAHTFRPSSFDFEGAADSLVRSLPSIRHVFLTISGFLSNWAETDDSEDPGFWQPSERWYVDRGWRISKSEAEGGQPGGQGLVELHSDVAETIIRKEELVVTESDEVNEIRSDTPGTKLNSDRRRYRSI